MCDLHNPSITYYVSSHTKTYEQAAIGIHRYDPRIGILIFNTSDNLVDSYWLGFWHVTVSNNLERCILVLKLLV